MEEAYSLSNYLPNSYKRVADSDYIDFLWDAFQSNYEKEKYQFAYLSFHMLFMSFVYFNVWQIKNNLGDDFRKALTLKDNQRESDFLGATSPFVFWKENERSIFGFFKLVGCPKEKIGNYKKMVNLRNDIAHTNGNIFFDNEVSLLEKVEELLRYVAEIQSYSKGVIQECYKRFLLSSWDEETREYLVLEDQIQEVLIHDNFLSAEDIKFCLEFEINSLSAKTEFDSMKQVHNVFMDAFSDEEA